MASDLTPAERRLLVALLHAYADRLGNASCNDFDLREEMPDLNERNAFVRAFEERNRSPVDYVAKTDPNERDGRLADFCVVRMLAWKVAACAR